MGRRQAPAADSGGAPEFTRVLLARLDLPPEAGRHDVEVRHDRLVAFLASAPPELHGWANAQSRAVEAAFVLLSGPAEAEADPGAEAEADPADLPDDEVDPDEPTDRAPHTARRPRRSRLLPLALVVVVVGVVYGVYRSGTPDSVPEISAIASASPSAQPLDRAKVATLMEKVSKNPADVAALRSLGDLYFQAGDYTSAATWQKKILDRDPKDVTALLALGAARFNSGDAVAAERHWLAVVALDPKQAEAHYDLGFLYLSRNPPDIAKVKSEWSKVVQIDPTSDIARTVSSHLQALTSPSATPAASAPATGR